MAMAKLLQDFGQCTYVLSCGVPFHELLVSISYVAKQQPLQNASPAVDLRPGKPSVSGKHLQKACADPLETVANESAADDLALFAR